METIKELTAICRRSRATLMQDALGATALSVMLIVALHLPRLV